MSNEVKDYYRRESESAERYNARRFKSPGGEAVSGRELMPFRSWLADSTGGRLLDAGSGTGRVLSVLTPQARANATAVDASEQMLEYLRKTYPETNILQGDLFEFQPPGQFDIVTSLRVLDHFPLSDQEVLLNRFKSFCSPGGRIIVSVLVGPTLESMVSSMVKGGHMNYFHSRRQYAKLFDRCSLELVRRFDAFVIPRGILYRSPRLLVPPAMAIDSAAGKLARFMCSYMTCELKVLPS